MRRVALIGEEVKVLSAILATITFSGVLSELMSKALLPGGTTFIIEVLGAQLSFTPVSAGVMIVSFVAGEIFLVFNLSRGGHFAEIATLLSLSLIGGSLSLFFGKNFFDTFFPASRTVLMMTLSFSIFLGYFATFLILIDECPYWVRNLVLLLFAGTIGAFFGLIFSTVAVLALLSSLVLVDIISTYSRSKLGALAESPMTSLVTQEWSIGVGDFVSYAIITSHSLVTFGVVPFLASLSLVGLGSYITIRWATISRTPFVPGLVITISLGIMPILIMIL